MDFIYLFLIVVFAVVTAGLVAGCAALGDRK